MRPVAPYFGGKWRTAPWIISHFPPHETYIEPFGGVGSVLLRKPPSRVEIFNEVNDYIVNLFQVLRDPGSADELIRRLHFTPYARTVFNQAVEEADAADPIARAWALIVRIHFSIAHRENNSENDFGARLGGKRPAHHFGTYPDCLIAAAERLKWVIIENLDGPDLIRRYSRSQGADVLVYCDPPYLPSTRSTDKKYRQDMTEEDHIKLAEIILSSPMMFIVSGYDSGLYDDLYKGWRKVYKKCSFKRECVWLSPNIKEADDD
jgi:DNA adenine methylase